MASWNDPAVWERLRIRGYCALFAKRHVVELHDLSEQESIALMRDLRNLSRIVQTITGAIKINFDMHGNTIPHLHVHLIPRYRGDELEEPGKTLGNLTRPGFAPQEFSEFSTRLRLELESLRLP